MTDFEYQHDSLVVFQNDNYSTPPVHAEFDYEDPYWPIVKVTQAVDFSKPDSGVDTVYFDAQGLRDFAERVLAVLDEDFEADSFTDSLDLSVDMNYNTGGTTDTYDY